MARFSIPPESRAARRVGTVLAGKYEIESVLGTGGMASVFVAAHRNGRRVALKLLHEELGIHKDVRARFVREGYVANAVGHPGAVLVFDDDEAEDGAVFLVMELLEGETLADRCARRGGRLPCREVLALAHQLLDVLAAAHARGIVHRDIKPENLFLTTSGSLKVLDFGVARMREEGSALATATGARIGTPAFMPPEQALGRGEEIDARTDLWAAGATMFSLLAGRTVHIAPGAAELIVIHATTPARSLAEMAPDVPAPVCDAVDTALRFARDARFPDARAMQRALEEACLAAFGEPLDPAGVGPPAEPRVRVPRTEDESETLHARRAQATTQLTPPSQGAETPPSSRAAEPTLHGAPAPRPASAAGKTPPGPASARAALRSSADPSPRSAPSASDPQPTLAPSTSTLGRGLSARPPRPSAPPPSPPAAGKRRTLLVAAALVAVAAAAFWLGRATPETPGAPAPGTLAVSTPPATSSGSNAVSAQPVPAGPRCTAAADCRGSGPALCRKDDSVCVPLENDRCKVLASPGDIENDATLWIGAMFPTSTPDPFDYGPRSAQSIDLARRDFAETTGGLLPARPGGPRRPIAVVLCDDREEPERVAAHLVREVRVPAILGFARSKEVMDLATSLFLPNGVLALAANTASTLRDIPPCPAARASCGASRAAPTWSSPCSRPSSRTSSSPPSARSRGRSRRARTSAWRPSGSRTPPARASPISTSRPSASTARPWPRTARISSAWR